MLVSIDRAVAVMVDYLGQEVGKIPNPMTRFATLFAIGAMGANSSAFSEKAKLLGILSSDGMVDTCLVRSGFSTAFANGNTLEAFGMRFSATDGEELLRRLES